MKDREGSKMKMENFGDDPNVKCVVEDLCVEFLTKEVADQIENAIGDGDFEREITFVGKTYQAKELMRLTKHYKGIATRMVYSSIQSSIMSSKINVLNFIDSLMAPIPKEILDTMPEELKTLIRQLSESGPDDDGFDLLKKGFETLNAMKPESEQEDGVEDVTDNWFSNNYSKARRRIRPENNNN